MLSSRALDIDNISFFDLASRNKGLLQYGYKPPTLYVYSLTSAITFHPFDPPRYPRNSRIVRALRGAEDKYVDRKEKKKKNKFPDIISLFAATTSDDGVSSLDTCVCLS